MISIKSIQATNVCRLNFYLMWIIFYENTSTQRHTQCEQVYLDVVVQNTVNVIVLHQVADFGLNAH